MSLQQLIIVFVFLAVLYNLGAALYFMMSGQSASGRTVRSLSWRIGISVALILAVCAGIYTGWIKPHGIYH